MGRISRGVTHLPSRTGLRALLRAPARNIRSKNLKRLRIADSLEESNMSGRVFLKTRAGGLQGFWGADYQRIKLYPHVKPAPKATSST